MLFQPTNVIPSSFAGVGGDLIDATEGMTISWQVNGTSPMTGYKITIYQNNAASTQLYTTGQVNLSSPFYGVDGMGNIQRFSVTISAATLSSAGVTNGNSDGYKFSITQYWSGGSVAQTAENYFICQATPSAAIDTTEITSPTVTLTGTYAQDQGVGLDWVRWIITVDGTTVHDSGKIHTQELNYSYDGFLDSTTYDITLEYQTESGYQGSVSKTITSSWELYQTRVFLNPSATEGCTGVIIPSVPITFGYDDTTTYPSYTIDNGALVISNSSNSIRWRYRCGNTTNSKLAMVWQGVISNGSLDLRDRYSGSTYPYHQILLNSSQGLRVFVYYSSSSYYLTASVSIPRSDVYNKTVTVIVCGKKDRYGFNIWAITESGTVYSAETTTQGFPTGGIGVIELNGIQRCNYLGILNDAIDESDELFASLAHTTQPSLNDEWRLLSDWNTYGLEYIGTVLAKTTYPSSASIGIFSTYRENATDGNLEMIETTNGEKDIIDYGVKSGNTYTYFQIVAFPLGGFTPKMSIVTQQAPVTPCFWNWVVDTGVWDDKRGAYEYTGSYIFGLNLETDAFDNGNNPNLLTNFTQYPTRQGTNQNYLSGQLTAYLGHVDKERNVYIDTAAEAEAIRALSTSTDTKFLRSRKGERWMIDTSGPIRLSLGDKYREQPYTVSLPWVEVGDASDAALISLPGDAAWTDPTTVPAHSPYIKINGVTYIPVSGTMGINGNQYNF
jgi:hypothetical protein